MTNDRHLPETTGGIVLPLLPPSPGSIPPSPTQAETLLANINALPCMNFTLVGENSFGSPAGTLGEGGDSRPVCCPWVGSARAAHGARSCWFEASWQRLGFIIPIMSVCLDGYKVGAETGSRIQPVSFPKETSQCKVTQRADLHHTDYISAGLSRN